MSKKPELVRGYGPAMLIGATMDEIRLALGVTEEEFRILATPEGRPHLERMIVGLKSPVRPLKPVTYLKRLYGDEQIIVGPTDGTRLITEATDVFNFIDPNFRQWGFDVPAQPTAATKFVVSEQITDGTFVQNFDSLGRQRMELCSTPHQVIEFVVKYYSRFCSDRSVVFFLLQRAGVVFVAGVHVDSDGHLRVHVSPFSHVHVCRVTCQHRFVVLEPVPSIS